MDHSIVVVRGLHTWIKLGARPCRATQDRWATGKSSDLTRFTGEENDNSLQYSCLENPMDTMYFSMLKLLTVWSTTNCGKFLKRWEYQITLPVSWETCKQVKKQQLELDMKQLTGSKLGKEYYKAICCHPAYLTHMQSASVKCWTEWIISWNQECQEKHQQLQICRWYYPNGRK